LLPALVGVSFWAGQLSRREKNVAPVVSVSVPTKPLPPSPKAAPPPKGWFDEVLPPHVRLGSERPVYIYDTTKGLELELVYVPPGDFWMGAINGGPVEKPIHTHPMPYGYYMARTVVTWDQYRVFCHATNRAEPATPSWPITGSHPVLNVSWFDAVAFCDWAGLALPSEAEWEKAARGGEDMRHWPWGDRWIPGAANALDVSCPLTTGDPKEPTDDGFPYTAPVMSFPLDVSPYGAYDMVGNAYQWCADWFDPTIYLEYSNGRSDPPSEGPGRCLRGGSWQHSRYACTVTLRMQAFPNGYNDWISFRPCLRTKK